MIITFCYKHELNRFSNVIKWFLNSVNSKTSPKKITSFFYNKDTKKPRTNNDT